jgi:hypothetical protein
VDLSEMSKLSEAIDELLTEHSRIGSPVPGYILPGRPEAEVKERLTALGLDPAADVVEYFTWQDGIDNARWRREAGGGGTFLALYPLYESASLEEAGRLYSTNREVSAKVYGIDPQSRIDIPQVGYWAQTWLPLFLGDYSLAVDCRGGQTSVVWGQASHPGWGATTPLYGSLAGLVADIASRFRSGVFSWNAVLNGYDVDIETAFRLDDELAASTVGLSPYELV